MMSREADRTRRGGREGEGEDGRPWNQARSQRIRVSKESMWKENMPDIGESQERAGEV